jgi:hypothetical protein
VVPQHPRDHERFRRAVHRGKSARGRGRGARQEPGSRALPTRAHVRRRGYWFVAWSRARAPTCGFIGRFVALP